MPLPISSVVVHVHDILSSHDSSTSSSPVILPAPLTVNTDSPSHLSDVHFHNNNASLASPVIPVTVEPVVVSLSSLVVLPRADNTVVLDTSVTFRIIDKPKRQTRAPGYLSEYHCALT